MRNPCVDETVQYLDCGGGYVNLWMISSIALNIHIQTIVM